MDDLTKSSLNSAISKVKPLIRQFSIKKVKIIEFCPFFWCFILARIYWFFFDINQAVNEPALQSLASQKDNYIARCDDNEETSFCNFEKQTCEKTSILLCENFGINTLTYHGSGDYVLAGVNSSYVNKQQGYISTNRNSSSENYIKQFGYQQHDGNVFASGSVTGDIVLYDSQNMQCVKALSKIHENKAIHCIEFGKSIRCHLLSHDKDHIIHLRDLRDGAQIKKALDVTQSVASSDCKNNARIIIFDGGTGDGDHKMPVTCFEAVPNEATFITCGMDYKVKFVGVMEKQIIEIMAQRVI